MSENVRKDYIEEEEEYFNDNYPEDNDSIDISNVNIKKSPLDKKLDFMIEKTNSYYKKLNKVYKNKTDLNNSFDKMKNVETNTKISILWDYLLQNFKNNFEYIIANYDIIKKKNLKLSDNEQKIKMLKKQSKTLKNKIATKERIYQFNFNKYNEMIFETNLLKEFMIYLMILLIIPILRLSNIINKTFGIVSYLGLLFLGIIYYSYGFMNGKHQRDNVFFGKLNFDKPDPDKLKKENDEIQEEDSDLEESKTFLQKILNNIGLL